MIVDIRASLSRQHVGSSCDERILATAAGVQIRDDCAQPR
jgi:hypothetical protein